MAASPEPTLADLVRCARAFTLTALERDAVKLRPKQPRVRAPITPLAQTIYRTLTFRFENVATGQCNPALPTIATAAGCAESSVKRLLPELRRTDYLTWRAGRRKRVKTRAGWRTVRSSNQYQMTCPRRHLPELRRALIQASGGQQGPLVQVVVARFTPPSEEAKATAKLIDELAADLRPRPVRTPTAGPDPPPRAPPATAGPVEVGGLRVEDPQLGRVLSGLWAALETRERREHSAGNESGDRVR